MTTDATFDANGWRPRQTARGLHRRSSPGREDHRARYAGLGDPAAASTAEVASEMCISANTVKTYLRNIYRKLAATHRGEAVRRARQLRLI